MSIQKISSPLLGGQPKDKNGSFDSQNDKFNLGQDEEDIEMNGVNNLNKKTKSKGEYVKESPIDQYNFVMEQYNNPVNTVDGVQLRYLKKSALFDWVNSLFHQPNKKCIISLCMLLGCGINVVFLLVILLAFFIYLKNEAIFKRNQVSVRDPFMKMIFSEEICLSMNVDFHYFRIDFKDIDNFSFNFDTMNFIKARMKDSMIEFMVYNSSFYEKYAEFIKTKRRFSRWILISFLLTSINILVLFFLYSIWLKQYL